MKFEDSVAYMEKVAKGGKLTREFKSEVNVFLLESTNRYVV